MAILQKPATPPQSVANPPTTSRQIHWSMRLMSVVSLFTLAIYSYVLNLCRRQSRNLELDGKTEKRRIRFAAVAFGLDLVISAYFGAATPLLLKHGGLVFDRKRMPRPLFWFFAITGFVPTASMALTVIGGQRWRNQIKKHPAWRTFHGITALLAYFSWWLACAPVFFMALVGEERALEIIKKSGLLGYSNKD